MSGAAAAASGAMSLINSLTSAFANTIVGQANSKFASDQQMRNWRDQFSQQNSRQDWLNANEAAIRAGSFRNAGLNPIMAMSGSTFSNNVASPSPSLSPVNNPGINALGDMPSIFASLINAKQVEKNMEVADAEIGLKNSQAALFDQQSSKVTQEILLLRAQTTAQEYLNASTEERNAYFRSQFDNMRNSLQVLAEAGDEDAKKELSYLDKVGSEWSYDAMMKYRQMPVLLATYANDLSKAEFDTYIRKQQLADPNVVDALVKMPEAEYQQVRELVNNVMADTKLKTIQEKLNKLTYDFEKKYRDLGYIDEIVKRDDLVATALANDLIPNSTLYKAYMSLPTPEEKSQFLRAILVLYAGSTVSNTNTISLGSNSGAGLGVPGVAQGDYKTGYTTTNSSSTTVSRGSAR
ncbi:minor capsid protein [Capybara microvirus Cap1_SP_90]|nr:minor capsid protein [Capybara microvirus Cap1_SP_90]